MQDLNNISINFDQNQVIILNLCLGILMFGVALDLKIADFQYIFKNPKAVISGMISQWILLPLFTLVLVWIIRPEYSLAMGMILIAACPGGNVSNYAVHLAGANAALSVILTMISTLLCAFSTPFIFAQLKKFIPSSIDHNIDFEISFGDMILTIGQLIVIPLIIGFLMNEYMPKITSKLRKPIKKISFIIFIGFVVAAIAGNLENLKNYISIVFFIVLIHNSLALFIGFSWARYLIKLPAVDAQTISIETGIQNSGLALILIFNYFDGTGGMALIAAWWSVWHLLSALGLAFWWKRGQGININI